MNRDSGDDSSATECNDTTQFFFGTPSNEEVVQYFLRQKRLVDLKNIQGTSEIESSPDLSESFENILQQRKQQVSEEKKKNMKEVKEYSESPRTSKSDQFRQCSLSNETAYGPDNTLMLCSDDSFLDNEKMCNNTLHLNNVSEHLIDLTAFDVSLAAHQKNLKKTSSFADETRLNDVEAPSFFLLNNSSMISPNKNSPLIAVHANRPSTILEVSEVSTSNRTGMSSYRTALTGRSETASSEDYKTANEETFSGSIEEDILIKMPKIRSFYEEVDLTKDSLDSTGKNQQSIDMTKDSLDSTSRIQQSNDVQNVDSSPGDSSSGVDSSYDQRDESESGEQMNDTLEQIEYMLAQHQKLQEQKNSRFMPPSPMTPAAHSQPSSSAKPKIFARVTPIVSKNSPLIKFSPATVKNSPSNDAPFKRPGVQTTTTKIPQPAFTSNKKFQHIASPIARYINDTPGCPLSSNVRLHPGIGKSPKFFNFRDSESFANENDSMNTAYKGPSLPALAKTKSSAMTHVFDQRDHLKTPGGVKIQKMLANTSPSVTVHQGHIKTNDRPKVFQTLNDTAISEQSFADLSLMSGDASVRVVEGVKRVMK